MKDEKIRSLALELAKELVKKGKTMVATDSIGGFDVSLYAHGKLVVENTLGGWHLEWYDNATQEFVAALLAGKGKYKPTTKRRTPK